MSTLSPEQLEELAKYLDDAQVHGQAVTKITDRYPDLDDDDAYDIQDLILERNLARGAKLAGLKMGLTSNAKMKQMGVDNPIRGFLLDSFACPEGDSIDTSNLIHPKLEPEIAFVTREELSGPNCGIEHVLEATDFVVPALEIIDSRYENFRFDLKSVIADNTSACRFVVGGRIGDPRELDLTTLGVVLEKNGEIAALGAGAAVLENPAQSVATLANMLSTRGQTIPAGTLVLTGGLTAAVAVEAGDCITVRYQHLGSLTVRFS